MNITNVIVGIAVKPVIVVIAALVGTEFLIGTTMNYVAAIKTSFFHSTNVLIKIIKTVFKRIQTTIND